MHTVTSSETRDKKQYLLVSTEVTLYSTRLFNSTLVNYDYSVNTGYLDIWYLDTPDMSTYL